MRNVLLALAAAGVIGWSIPAASPAQAETVVIKQGHHHRHWDRGHRKKVVIIKKRHHHRHGDVVMRGR